MADADPTQGNRYEHSVPEQKQLDDVTGDDEHALMPTLLQLVDAIEVSVQGWGQGLDGSCGSKSAFRVGVGVGIGRVGRLVTGRG